MSDITITTTTEYQKIQQCIAIGKWEPGEDFEFKIGDKINGYTIYYDMKGLYVIYENERKHAPLVFCEHGGVCELSTFESMYEPTA